MLPVQYQDHVTSARADGIKFVSPYRLGIYVGMAGARLPSPYHTEKATNCYNRGVMNGTERANREADKKEPT